jgi:hypothetical protein
MRLEENESHNIYDRQPLTLVQPTQYHHPFLVAMMITLKNYTIMEHDISWILCKNLAIYVQNNENQTQDVLLLNLLENLWSIFYVNEKGQNV